MDGQQLDRVGLGRGRDVERVALVVLGCEVGQQRGQGDVAVDGLELRHGLDEQVEVLAPRLRGRRHRRRELDVDAGDVDDPPHDVEQRLADVGAQLPELAGQQVEPLPRLRRVRRVAGVDQRVVERRHLRGIDAVGDADELVGDGVRRRAPAAVARQLLRAPAEQPQVARADRPAWAGEQREQRGVGR